MNLEFQKEFINFCVNNSEHILKFSIPNKSYEKYSIQTHGMYMCFRDPEDILNAIDLYVNEDFHASNTFRKLLDMMYPYFEDNYHFKNLYASYNKWHVEPFKRFPRYTVEKTITSQNQFKRRLMFHREFQQILVSGDSSSWHILVALEEALKHEKVIKAFVKRYYDEDVTLQHLFGVTSLWLQKCDTVVKILRQCLNDKYSIRKSGKYSRYSDLLDIYLKGTSTKVCGIVIGSGTGIPSALSVPGYSEHYEEISKLLDVLMLNQ